MRIDWRRWSAAPDLRSEDHSITVTFHDGRVHTVHVEENPESESVRLWATAARPAVVSRLADPDVYGWERNRGSDLVTFKVDRRGRLIGETWLPIPGLGKSEWQLCVRLLAMRCDRLEYLLTGRDTD